MISGLPSGCLVTGRLREAAGNGIIALGSVTSIWPRPLIGLDAKIDSMQREIETKAIETIARHQPLAVDLRELVSAFHIVNDLERIGDLAKSICKRALVMDSAPPSKLSVPVLNQLGSCLRAMRKETRPKLFRSG
jgi:phosphate transport system protein